MAERTRSGPGILARLALTVFGGFGLLLSAMAAVALNATQSSVTIQGEILAAMQLPYARAAVIAAAGGAVPRAAAVASVREQLALAEPGLQLRVFDGGRPVGDDLPVDALDQEGLAAVRAAPSASHGLKDPSYAGPGGFRYYAPLGSDPEVVVSVRFPTELQKGAIARAAVRAFEALGVLMLLICAGQFLVLRRTTRRVTALARAVTSMAESGDFTRQLPPDTGEDEIGELGGGVHALATLLSATAGALQGASAQLAEAGQALTRTVDDQTHLLRQHTVAIEEAATSAEEIRQTSETASGRAEAVLDAAVRAGELGDSGESAVRQTLDALQEIRHQVMAMGEQISVVAERAHQISSITESVKDIADSSNMLALNAAIEAVRSGERGKGFALVAREMRSLADQSIKATERVREILEDVSVAIQQASDISDRGTQRIESGLGQLARSGESVRALVKMVSESSQSARVIAAAVRQQNAGIVQIVRSLADQRALAERTSEGLTQTQAHAKALQALTHQVSDLLKSYRV
ncbi:MAG TPA: methyl-accepting chemotaxis protein [Myxococcales bacterium]|jgi:methyl-accepting chemotaxis protein|nr:methyl-accepting chemotaxis protein [Myxococcales bacterium]